MQDMSLYNTADFLNRLLPVEFQSEKHKVPVLISCPHLPSFVAQRVWREKELWVS